MPNAPTGEQPRLVKVTLHVYDFLEESLNGFLRQIGTGGFHCGVEVYGKEWSFRRTHFGTGVFWIMPKTCTAHKYRESVPMGKVSISPESFGKLVDDLKREWPGRDYDILKRNCCVFSNELCQKLGVGSIPDWITNLAGVGADMRSVVRRPLRQMEGALLGDTAAKQQPQPTPGPKTPPSGPRRTRPPGGDPRGYEELPPVPVQEGVFCGVPHSMLWKLCVVLAVALVAASAVCAAAVSTGRLRVRQLLRGGHAPQLLPGGAPAPFGLPPQPSAQPMGRPLGDGKGRGPLFDCSRGFATYKADWSAEQLGWCCMQDSARCPVTRPSEHDCQDGYANCANAWSLDKQHWCLEHSGVACTTSGTASTSYASPLSYDGGSGSDGGAYAGPPQGGSGKLADQGATQSPYATISPAGPLSVSPYSGDSYANQTTIVYVPVPVPAPSNTTASPALGGFPEPDLPAKSTVDLGSEPPGPQRGPLAAAPAEAGGGGPNATGSLAFADSEPFPLLFPTPANMNVTDYAQSSLAGGTSDNPGMTGDGRLRLKK